MGADHKFFVKDSNGGFKRFDNIYDVTIQFDNKEDMEAFLILLQKINDLKMELPRAEGGEKWQ